MTLTAPTFSATNTTPTLRWRMKLSTAISQFVNDLKLDKSPETVKAYESDLRRMAAKAQQDSVLKFTADLVKLELRQCKDQQLSMSTIHRKRACFSSFGKWGVRNDVWLSNPVDKVESIKKPKHKPKPFNDADVEALMASVDTMPAPRRIRFMLLSLTGMRVSPVCGIRVGDVSFSPPLITALVKGAKTQIIQMHPALIEPLRSYIAQHTDGKPQTYLFRNRRGGPMHRRTVARELKILGARLGVWKVHAHRFRHTFATRMLERTKDLAAVQEALGHADISTTRGYAEVANDRLAQAVATVPWVMAK